jgi:hypothetical protein
VYHNCQQDGILCIDLHKLCTLFHTLYKFRFILKKVEMIVRLTGFPLKTCGNDKQKQPFKIVILGLDPGIQGVSNLNTKDPKFLIS